MEAVIDAAGKLARRGGGQGVQLDQDVKVAVEAHAMNTATEFYREDWDVEDVHGTESYDLICRRQGEMKHIEVKGTTMDGPEVILTPNVVRHAREYLYTALFILSNITIERADDGTVTATGGTGISLIPGPSTTGRSRPLASATKYRIDRSRQGEQPTDLSTPRCLGRACGRCWP
jgi:hypothetical protein